MFNDAVRKGRKPRVDKNLIFEAFVKRKHEIINEQGLISPVSSNVWKVLSEDLNYKLPSNSLYIMFYEDRHEWKSRLIKLLGLEDHVKNLIEVDQCSSSDTELSLESNKDEFIKKLFKINIHFNVFTQIKPTTVTYKDKKSRYRSYDILPSGIWTDTINDIFLKEHKLPCNFIYKRGKVSRDSRNSEHYIWFCAKCKDCGSEMEGWSDTEPK
ncbi:Uncharacterized protein FWK35_00037890, partial [Aphis craccivora]